MADVTKYYISIDKDTSAPVGQYTSVAPEGETPPVPVPMDNCLLQEVSENDLGGLTPAEFCTAKNAVLVDEEFDSWVDKHSGLECAISEDPKSDGSNTPTVSMSLGLGGAAFKVMTGVGVALGGGHEGDLDGSGEGSFTVNITDSELTEAWVLVSPDGYADFVPVLFSFEVEAGDF